MDEYEKLDRNLIVTSIHVDGYNLQGICKRLTTEIVNITGTFLYGKSKISCVNGLLHRDDGPAFIILEHTFYLQHNFWFLNGVKLTLSQFIEQCNLQEYEKLELVMRYG